MRISVKKYFESRYDEKTLRTKLLIKKFSRSFRAYLFEVEPSESHKIFLKWESIPCDDKISQNCFRYYIAAFY